MTAAGIARRRRARVRWRVLRLQGEANFLSSAMGNQQGICGTSVHAIRDSSKDEKSETSAGKPTRFSSLPIHLLAAVFDMLGVMESARTSAVVRLQRVLTRFLIFSPMWRMSSSLLVFRSHSASGF